MQDLKQIIAENIATLRKKNGLTQSELAEKLNYSDKSISKWERGEASPDVDVLCRIADLFEVKLDTLVREDVTNPNTPVLPENRRAKTNKLVISLLAVTLVWTFALVLYVIGLLLDSQTSRWTLFTWAIPVSFIVAIVFNSIWGKAQHNFIYIALLVWTTLLGVFLQFIDHGATLWPIFLLGIPVQVAIILWSQLKNKKALKSTPPSADRIQEQKAVKDAARPHHADKADKQDSDAL